MFHAASLALARHCTLRKFYAAAKFGHVATMQPKARKKKKTSHDAVQKVWQVQKYFGSKESNPGQAIHYRG
jgi:hypothetical protein